ncbi:nicotinate-nucleotide--dimethylbenzimidazole phosphoribosyltransferase [Streptomyces avermitilis]|uniref:nicotinate-nucleotide--dimethylbenzimidazole phosphoribosyltransferase n=1 Tax=Streptomyces avermitilis TaxID=33903 RepID=UPI0033B33A5D
MTDTGQVPGEGLPENAGMVEQPGVPAPGAYTYLDPSDTAADDDDLLLMPGQQGAWGNEMPQAMPAPAPVVHEPGPHETDGRDSGSVDVSAVRTLSQAAAPQATPPRRPLHLGPPTPDVSSSPVRSLADRGPADAPLRHMGPPTTGPEYLDVPQLSETPPQGAVPWGAPPQPQAVPPVSPEGTPAEWVVPEAAPVVTEATLVVPEAAPGPGTAPADEPAPFVEPEQASETSDVPAFAAAEAPDAPAFVEAPQPPQAPDAPAFVEAPQAPQPPQTPDAPAFTEVPHVSDEPPAADAQHGGVAALTDIPPAAETPFAAPEAEAPHAVDGSPDGATHPQVQYADGTGPVPDGSPEPQAPDPTPFPAAPDSAQPTGGAEHIAVTPTAPDTAVPAPDTAVPAPVADFPVPPHDAAADPVQQAAAAEAVQQAGTEQPGTEQPGPAQDPHPAPEIALDLHEVPDPALDPQQAPDQALDPQSAHVAEPQLAGPAVHIADAAAQFVDTALPDENARPVADEVQPHLVAEAQAQGHAEAEPAPQYVEHAAAALHGVPVGVGAHAVAPQASAGRAQHGEQPAPGDPAGLPGFPPEPHADQSLGQFVPVEGAVPTTPHLAPTPPHAMTVPPLPAEEQPVAEEAAPAVVEPDEAPHQLADEAPHELPAEAPAEAQAPAPVKAEAEAPAVTVPAPREAEAPVAAQPPVSQLPTPEPLLADSEPVVAQHADDLDTQVADQEESTAAVEDVRESTGPAAPGYDEAEREAVLRVMRERRDIRNGFRSDPIPHEVLLRVLEAAHTAPSVGHSQPWDFVVIRSADTRRSMHELAMRQRDAYAKSLPKGRAKQFKELKIEAILDTPVNIVVTADPTRGGRHTLGRHTQPQMAPYSSALAVENLWLAARAEGLGVGWVSFFDEREMVRELGLPEHLEVVAYLCVGYVDEFPDEPELMQAGWSKRRPLSWVVHEETYGRRALPGEEPHDLLAETVSNIRPLDAKALGEAWERQKRMTKPAGALGMLEIISAQLSGLSRQCPPPIPEPAAVAIFAGDHGVHAQGVTPWPQEVTAQMVANFLGGGAVCNAFANQVGAEVCVIDVGVASDLPATPGLLPRKVRAGTADMTTGPALTREEVKAAIEVGIETARDLVSAGNKTLLTGEMGIANTTASAALISVYTGADPAEVTGRGTGINDETLARKTEVVRRALELHQPDPADPIGVLAAIGGLEHAAMVGLLLGGASLRTPVILDGVSAGAAALVARAIAPEVLAACIAGHRSAEPGHVAALNKLGLRPLVDLDLRLGEGTGALLALPVVQSAARAMHEVATFDSAGVTEK